jgi:hypothetical protein
MHRRFSLGLVVLALFTLVLLPSVARANGGKAKNYTYVAELPLGNDRSEVCRLSIEVNPVLFRLMTLNNQYYVLLLRGQNETGIPLKLSSADDKVEILFSGKKIQGILNLAAADSASWDHLTKYMRETLAYPAQIDPHEEEGLYIYVPIDSLKAIPENEMPRSIVFTVKSLNRSVQLHLPSAARK